MSTIFKGSGVALVTPFTNGEVDYTATKESPYVRTS